MGDYGHVHQTFEEFAGRQLDGLYHGALFLHGGEKPPAEDLVLWTLTGAIQEFRKIEGRTALEQWLEGKLVEVFLARAPSGEDFFGEAPSLEAASFEAPWSRGLSQGIVEIDHEALFRAGRLLPPLARAAIWLVVFRRWSYDEASSVLETNLDGLKDLLRYRGVLVTAVLRRPLDRSGTDHDRRH